MEADEKAERLKREAEGGLMKRTGRRGLELGKKGGGVALKGTRELVKFGGLGHLIFFKETFSTSWKVLKTITGSIWEEIAKATGAGDLLGDTKKIFKKVWGKKNQVNND